MSEPTSESSDAFNLHALLQEVMKMNAQSGMLSTIKIDDEKGTLAVVKPAVAHLVSEAKSYALNKIKWDDTAQVKKGFKSLYNFLNSAEKQIGKDNLSELLEPIFEKVFHDTVFHGLAVCKASQKLHWKSI